MVAHAVLS